MRLDDIERELRKLDQTLDQANSLMAKGEFESAGSVLSSIVDKLKETYGENHQSVFSCLKSLGDCCYELGQYHQAVLYYRDCLALEERSADHDALRKVSTQFGIARALERLGQTREATDNYEAAIGSAQSAGLLADPIYGSIVECYKSMLRRMSRDPSVVAKLEGLSELALPQPVSSNRSQTTANTRVTSFHSGDYLTGWKTAIFMAGLALGCWLLIGVLLLIPLLLSQRGPQAQRSGAGRTYIDARGRVSLSVSPDAACSLTVDGHLVPIDASTVRVPCLEVITALSGKRAWLCSTTSGFTDDRGITLYSTSAPEGRLATLLLSTKSAAQKYYAQCGAYPDQPEMLAKLEPGLSQKDPILGKVCAPTILEPPSVLGIKIGVLGESDLDQGFPLPDQVRDMQDLLQKPFLPLSIYVYKIKGNNNFDTYYIFGCDGLASVLGSSPAGKAFPIKLQAGQDMTLSIGTNDDSVLASGSPANPAKVCLSTISIQQALASAGCSLAAALLALSSSIIFLRYLSISRSIHDNNAVENLMMMTLAKTQKWFVVSACLSVVLTAAALVLELTAISSIPPDRPAAVRTLAKLG